LATAIIENVGAAALPVRRTSRRFGDHCGLPPAPR
jgi:hypothetical protein